MTDVNTPKNPVPIQKKDKVIRKRNKVKPESENTNSKQTKELENENN